MTDLIQLIYSSKPFGFDEAALNGILLTARRNNPRDAITGALICRHDLYLQLLEGPQAAVEARYSSIAHDDRHLEVVKRVSRRRLSACSRSGPCATTPRAHGCGVRRRSNKAPWTARSQPNSSLCSLDWQPRSIELYHPDVP